MPASAPARRHLGRWIALAIVAVVVAASVALAIHVHALLQPQRFTALLQGDLSAVGLTLKLQAPAEPMLFPHPGVRLKGVRLTNRASGTALLTAAAATIVVPWRTLLRGAPAIERVDIQGPRLDLGEIKLLLARLPHHAGPPRLPTIATGVHLRHGTLTTHGTPLLFGVSIDTGALAPQQPFRLDAAARDPSGRTLAVSLVTTPRPPAGGAIEFNPLHLDASIQGGAALDLHGRAHWRGGEALSLQLEGTLQHPALAPAAAATSGNSAAAVHTVAAHISVRVAPREGTVPATVAIGLAGPNAAAKVSLRPSQLGAWWQQTVAANPGAATPPTPFAGTAKVQRLDLGWLKASGIEIEAGPGAAPAASSSVAPPASATH